MCVNVVNVCPFFWPPVSVLLILSLKFSLLHRPPVSLPLHVSQTFRHKRALSSLWEGSTTFCSLRVPLVSTVFRGGQWPTWCANLVRCLVAECTTATSNRTHWQDESSTPQAPATPFLLESLRARLCCSHRPLRFSFFFPVFFGFDATAPPPPPPPFTGALN